VRLINETLQAVIEDPKARQRLFEIGAEPIGGPVEQFSQRVRSDYQRWGRFIKDSRIKLE